MATPLRCFNLLSRMPYDIKEGSEDVICPITTSSFQASEMEQLELSIEDNIAGLGHFLSI